MDNEKVLNKLSDIENILKLGISAVCTAIIAADSKDMAFKKEGFDITTELIKMLEEV